MGERHDSGNLSAALQTIRLTGDLVTHVTSWRVLDPRPAEYGEFPPALDPRLLALLRRQGIEQLYIHQSLAVAQALAGANVVVVTPTASGKTLCYNLPVLQALLQDESACALYLFPTKALAHDQLGTLQGMVEPLDAEIAVAAYDGDTPSGRRTAIRDRARILLSNPDMLHAGILPYHTRWQRFFSRLRYIIIDEMHHYRGIFGSHVANVLRRLARICRFYGSQPQFIGCSATIANPDELARRLLGQPVDVISQNGAPRGQRSFVFYNPPILNERLGLRRSPMIDAATWANRLLDHDVQTIVFGRTRLSTELLLTQLRQDAERVGRDPAVLRGYRGGYLPAERRQIEASLRSGAVRGVVATNALELGVDVGGLSACVMVGYPGTIASTWQQAGRAGRGVEESAAILIASSSPLDQYIIAHPDYFFGQSPEHALINPDNLYLLLNHVKCAVFELPFSANERYGEEDVQEVLRYLEEAGHVRQMRGLWRWAGQGCPAHEISLRTADPNDVTIIERAEDGSQQTIGQLDRPSVPIWLYEGAIYWHEGQQYVVEALDWEGGTATVRPVTVDYYTEALRSTRIDIERVLETSTRHGIDLTYGEVLMTSRVTGYRRLRLGTYEHLGWGEVNLPEQQFLTMACWLSIPDELVSQLQSEGWWVGEQVESRGPNWPRQRELALKRDHHLCRWCGATERPGRQHDVHHIVPFRDFHWLPGQNENYREANQLSNLISLCPSCHRRAEQGVAVQSTLGGLGRVLGRLLPLFLMCDPGDIGVHTEIKAPQTGLPTLFVYDAVPAGVGLSEQMPQLYDELLARATELITDCSCTSGCPSCIGPSTADNPRAKDQVLRLITSLRGLCHL